MNVGIVIPTELESNQLIRLFSPNDCNYIQKKPFFSGSLKNIPITLAICGVGKSNSAHATGLLIQIFNPTIVINLGVAGAYPYTGLDIGDLVIARSERYIDEGLTTHDGFFISMQDLGIRLTGQDDITVFRLNLPSKLPKGLKIGDFATVSTCTGSLSKGLEIAKNFGCICENMEGAAIAHVCYYNNIPLIELRCISNIIKDRDGSGIDKGDLSRASLDCQSFLIENLDVLIDEYKFG